jgi:predicted acetyltransferase
MTMKQMLQEDDAGTYMLKKMGIWKWLNKDYQNNMYKDIQVIAELYMNYFNQRTLAYEPLLESWYL